MKYKRIYLTLCMFLLLALTGCAGQTADAAPVSEASEETGSFTVTFITIGKGDAFLLSPSDGTHYLIDTGKKKDYPQIDRLLRTKGIDRLDGIFLSHGHKDHAGGLESLLSSFPVDTLYLSGTDSVSYQDIDAEGLASKAALFRQYKDHAGGLESLLSSFPVDTLYLSGTDSVSYQDIDAEGLASKAALFRQCQQQLCYPAPDPWFQLLSYDGGRGAGRGSCSSGIRLFCVSQCAETGTSWRK